MSMSKETKIWVDSNGSGTTQWIPLCGKTLRLCAHEVKRNHAGRLVLIEVDLEKEFGKLALQPPLILTRGSVLRM